MRKRRTFTRPVVVAPRSIHEQAFTLGEKAGDAAHKRDHETSKMWSRDFRYLYTSNPEKRQELQAEFDKGYKYGFGDGYVGVSGR